MAPKPSKRDAILDAMLDVVTERGFHDAPMSLIAQRAGASPGVIYHHFGSKDEIIQALYERIRLLKRNSILAGYRPGMDDREAFLQSWLNIYHFYRRHHRETRFLEQFHAAGFVCAPAPSDEDKSEAQITFEKRFRGRSQGGIFKDLPPEVMQELTLGIITRLAAASKKLTDREVSATAETIWTGLTSK